MARSGGYRSSSAKRDRKTAADSFKTAPKRFNNHHFQRRRTTSAVNCLGRRQFETKKKLGEWDREEISRLNHEKYKENKKL